MQFLRDMEKQKTARSQMEERSWEILLWKPGRKKSHEKRLSLWESMVNLWLIYG